MCTSFRNCLKFSDQVGVWLSLARALRSGRRGRRFKSSHPDHFFCKKMVNEVVRLHFVRRQPLFS